MHNPRASGASDDELIRFFVLVPASSLAETQPQPIRFVDGHGWFPQAELSILSGAGAAGKTTLMVQLAVAVASQTEGPSFWLDRPVELRGAVLFFSAEENLNALHHKLFDIAAADPSINIRRHLSKLHFVDVSISTTDKCLLTTQRGKVIRTKAFAMLEDAIARNGIKLLILDNRAQILLIDEIQRNHATASTNEFRALAATYGVAVILLQHPSLSGMRTGSSGSTGFQNVSRNFVYMVRPDGSDVDPNTEDDGKRILRGIKVNSGKMGRVTNLQWQAGIYVCADEKPRAGWDIGRPEKAERVFLKLLAKAAERKRDLSDNANSGAYAPKIFVADSGREGINLREFEAAMERLFEAGKLEIEVLFPGKSREKRVIRAAMGG